MRHSDIRLWPAIALAGVLAAMPANMAKAETASSTVLANTCFSCHGTDGHSAGAMPSINGKPAKYIATNLKAFRSGKKQATVMNRIAKGFSIEEIESLAKYFSENKN